MWVIVSIYKGTLGLRKILCKSKQVSPLELIFYYILLLFDSIEPSV